MSDGFRRPRSVPHTRNKVGSVLALADGGRLSPNKEDVQAGIRLLEDVYKKPDTGADMQFECGYCMALGQCAPPWSPPSNSPLK